MRFSALRWPQFGALSDIVTRWVHASVAVDDRAFQDHKKFIGLCALVSASALFTLPIALADNHTFKGMEIVFAGGFIIPVLAGLFVSATGKLQSGAQGLIASVIALITVLTVMSGGLSAGALLAFLAVSVEAAFWGGRRNAGLSAILSLGGIFTVAVLAGRGTLSDFTLPPAAFFLLFGYAAVLAYRFAGSKSDYASENYSLKNRFQLLVENTSELVTKNDVNGATLFASPVSRTLLGTSATSLLNSGLLEKVHLQDRVLFLQSISNAATSNNDVTCQLRIRCKGNLNQVWKNVEMRSRSLGGANGKRTEIVSVFRDIDADANPASVDTSKQVDVDERNEAQRRFLTTISHELRTPLNAIIGFSEILTEELFGKMQNDRYLEYAGLIRESGGHLLSVVNDMLDASKIEAGKYELQISTFEVSSVTNATVDMLRMMASDKGVTVNADIQANLPVLQADKRACQQILINLLSNAIKFTPEGGKVRISAKQHGRSVKLRVKDTGIGFDKDFQSNVGEPFAQADNGYDRQHNGTGLGLSVVKGLIDLHSGSLDVHSEPGLGTTMTVTLPFKARCSAPVPANGRSDLVDLNDRKDALKNSFDANIQLDEGANRASLSA